MSDHGEWSDYETGRMGLKSWFRLRTYGPVGTAEIRCLIARLEQNLAFMAAIESEEQQPPSEQPAPKDVPQ